MLSPHWLVTYSISFNCIIIQQTKNQFGHSKAYLLPRTQHHVSALSIIIEPRFYLSKYSATEQSQSYVRNPSLDAYFHAYISNFLEIHKSVQFHSAFLFVWKFFYLYSLSKNVFFCTGILVLALALIRGQALFKGRLYQKQDRMEVQYTISRRQLTLCYSSRDSKGSVHFRT